ncbi:MAG: phage tail assembly protein [Gammaproteobacteria bacterium]
MLQTEFPFTLPMGYVDPEGNLHREGTMRLATAFDEIAPLRDPRVHGNAAYLLIILLSRVITKLGRLEQINPKTIEGLFAADLAYLQDLYRRLNENEHNRVRARCPTCEQDFEVELDAVVGFGATP